MSLDNLIAPKSSRQRMLNFDKHMKKFYEAQEYDKVISENEIKSDIEYNNQRTAKLLNESFETKRRIANQEREKMFKEKAEVFYECVPVLFSAISYKALPLDESFKKANSKYIIETALDLFKGLRELGLIKMDKKNKSAFSVMCEDIAVALTDTDPEKVELKQVVNYAIDNNQEQEDAIIDAVNGKVVDAIQDEKDIVALKEKLKASESYCPNEKSLFRYLHENNVHRVVREYPTYSKDTIMDLSFSETILHYTLLEMLHTCNLVKFNVENLNTLKKFICN